MEIKQAAENVGIKGAVRLPFFRKFFCYTGGEKSNRI